MIWSIIDRVKGVEIRNARVSIQSIFHRFSFAMLISHTISSQLFCHDSKTCVGSVWSDRSLFCCTREGNVVYSKMNSSSFTCCLFSVVIFFVYSCHSLSHVGAVTGNAYSIVLNLHFLTLSLIPQYKDTAISSHHQPIHQNQLGHDRTSYLTR